MLYYIDTGYACFGVEEKDGIVISAAPIAKWSIGKNITKVLKYFKDKKNAKIQEIKNENF